MWELLVGLIPDFIKSIFRWFHRPCEIKLAPSVHPSIPAIINGGNMQQFANLQIRFGSETELEFVDAVLYMEDKRVRCEQRDTKLNGGKDWNSFDFRAAELKFVPDQMISLKIRVADHLSHCCELSLSLQMKQYPHPDYSGIRSGRWEIQPRGIFKIRGLRRKKFF